MSTSRKITLFHAQDAERIAARSSVTRVTAQEADAHRLRPLSTTELANHWKQSKLCGSATRHRDRAKCFVSPMRFGSGSR